MGDRPVHKGRAIDKKAIDTLKVIQIIIMFSVLGWMLTVTGLNTMQNAVSGRQRILAP